jgi:hypothetical protein
MLPPSYSAKLRVRAVEMTFKTTVSSHHGSGSSIQLMLDALAGCGRKLKFLISHIPALLTSGVCPAARAHLL